MSSLKSSNIVQGMLHSVTCLNSLVSTVIINIAWGTLGDLYTTAICILPVLGTCIVADTASMPLVANLCTLDGLICLGTQNQNFTFLSHVTLSHLMLIWSSNNAGEG